MQKEILRASIVREVERRRERGWGIVAAEYDVQSNTASKFFPSSCVFSSLHWRGAGVAASDYSDAL
jgi:hypothetical protein